MLILIALIVLICVSFVLHKEHLDTQIHLLSRVRANGGDDKSLERDIHEYIDKYVISEDSVASYLNYVLDLGGVTGYDDAIKKASKLCDDLNDFLCKSQLSMRILLGQDHCRLLDDSLKDINDQFYDLLEVEAKAASPKYHDKIMQKIVGSGDKDDLIHIIKVGDQILPDLIAFRVSLISGERTRKEEYRSQVLKDKDRMKARERAINAAHLELNARNLVIAGLQNDVVNRDLDIANLNNRVLILDNRIVDLTADVANRDIDIKKLGDDIIALNDVVKDQAADIVSLNNDIVLRDNNIRTLNDDLTLIKAKVPISLDAKDMFNEILVLKDAVAKANDEILIKTDDLRKMTTKSKDFRKKLVAEAKIFKAQMQDSNKLLSDQLNDARNEITRITLDKAGGIDARVGDEMQRIIDEKDRLMKVVDNLQLRLTDSDLKAKQVNDLEDMLRQSQLDMHNLRDDRDGLFKKINDMLLDIDPLEKAKNDLEAEVKELQRKLDDANQDNKAIGIMIDAKVLDLEAEIKRLTSLSDKLADDIVIEQKATHDAMTDLGIKINEIKLLEAEGLKKDFNIANLETRIKKLEGLYNTKISNAGVGQVELKKAIDDKRLLLSAVDDLLFNLGKPAYLSCYNKLTVLRDNERDDDIQGLINGIMLGAHIAETDLKKSRTVVVKDNVANFISNMDMLSNNADTLCYSDSSSPNDKDIRVSGLIAPTNANSLLMSLASALSSRKPVLFSKYASIKFGKEDNDMIESIMLEALYNELNPDNLFRGKYNDEDQLRGQLYDTVQAFSQRSEIDAIMRYRDDDANFATKFDELVIELAKPRGNLISNNAVKNAIKSGDPRMLMAMRGPNPDLEKYIIDLGIRMHHLGVDELAIENMKKFLNNALACCPGDTYRAFGEDEYLVIMNNYADMYHEEGDTLLKKIDLEYLRESIDAKVSSYDIAKDDKSIPQIFIKDKLSGFKMDKGTMFVALTRDKGIETSPMARLSDYVNDNRIIKVFNCKVI